MNAVDLRPRRRLVGTAREAGNPAACSRARRARRRPTCAAPSSARMARRSSMDNITDFTQRRRGARSSRTRRPRVRRDRTRASPTPTSRCSAWPTRTSCTRKRCCAAAAAAARTALDYINQLRTRAYGNTSGNITDAQLTLGLHPRRARPRAAVGRPPPHRPDPLRPLHRRAGIWAWKGNVAAGKLTEAVPQPVSAAGVGADRQPEPEAEHRATDASATSGSRFAPEPDARLVHCGTRIARSPSRRSRFALPAAAATASPGRRSPVTGAAARAGARPIGPAVTPRRATSSCTSSSGRGPTSPMECETVLGPRRRRGGAGLAAAGARSCFTGCPWSQRYQPVSYSSTRAARAPAPSSWRWSERCRAAGVGHLSSTPSSTT